MVALPRQELDRNAAAPVILRPNFHHHDDPHHDPVLRAGMLEDYTELAARQAALMAQEWGGPPRRSFAHGDRACSQCAGFGRIVEDAHYVRGTPAFSTACDRCGGTGIA